MTNLQKQFEQLIENLHKAKPEERNELARRYAVTITELEKTHAYFLAYVVNYENTPS